MEVLTLVGGFRGLGAVSTQQILELGDWLGAQTANADQTMDRLSRLAGQGNVPEYSVSRLSDAYYSLGDQLTDLRDRLGTLEEPDLARWRSDALALISRFETWDNDARTVLGDEIGGRGLRMTILAIGSIVVLGGAAYAVYRISNKRRPRRRK